MSWNASLILPSASDGGRRTPAPTKAHFPAQVWLGVGGGRIGSTVSTSLLSVPRDRLDEGVGAGNLGKFHRAWQGHVAFALLHP